MTSACGTKRPNARFMTLPVRPCLTGSTKFYDLGERDGIYEGPQSKNRLDFCILTDDRAPDSCFEAQMEDPAEASCAKNCWIINRLPKPPRRNP